MVKKTNNHMFKIFIQSLLTLYCVGWGLFGGTVHSMEQSFGVEYWSGVGSYFGVEVFLPFSS